MRDIEISYQPIRDCMSYDLGPRATGRHLNRGNDSNLTATGDGKPARQTGGIVAAGPVQLALGQAGGEVHLGA